MRTVLSMLSSVHSGTQPTLPPLCHPTRETSTHHYTAEDHKKDIKLRSTFFKPDKVVITPAMVPPHPQKVAAWYEQMRESVTKATEGSSCQVEDSVQEKETGKGTSHALGEVQVGASRKDLTVMQSRTEPLNVDDEAEDKTRDQNEQKQFPKATEPSSTALEGDVLMSPPSVQSVSSSGSSGSCREQSLTSYQPPRPTSAHSPLVDLVPPFHSSPNEPDTSNTAATRTTTSLDRSPDEPLITSPPPPFHSTPIVACDDVGGNLESLTPVRTKEPAPNNHRTKVWCVDVILSPAHVSSISWICNIIAPSSC